MIKVTGKLRLFHKGEAMDFVRGSYYVEFRELGEFFVRIIYVMLANNQLMNDYGEYDSIGFFMLVEYLYRSNQEKIDSSFEKCRLNTIVFWRRFSQI